MKRTPVTLLTGLFALLLTLGVSGCNALGITGEDENEVRVTILEVGGDFLRADDAFTYRVTRDTEFEGLSGLADVSPQDEVEIEWEGIDRTTRRAVEVESGSYDETHDDD